MADSDLSSMLAIWDRGGGGGEIGKILGTFGGDIILCRCIF